MRRCACHLDLRLFFPLLIAARLSQITRRERKRLEQRMEERLNERTRIAREIHDSLLQGFQGLMFRLQAVREHLRRHPEAASGPPA